MEWGFGADLGLGCVGGMECRFEGDQLMSSSFDAHLLRLLPAGLGLLHIRRMAAQTSLNPLGPRPLTPRQGHVQAHLLDHWMVGFGPLLRYNSGCFYLAFIFTDHGENVYTICPNPLTRGRVCRPPAPTFDLLQMSKVGHPRLFCGFRDDICEFVPHV